MSSPKTAPFLPSPSVMRTGGAKNRTFLIHLEICNPHRLRRAVAIARTLKAGGHCVMISYELRIAFQLAPEDLETLFWDAGKDIEAARRSYPDLEFISLDTFCGSERDNLEAAQNARADAICDLLTRASPSHLIVWGGNFTYQRGTMEGVKRAGYLGRVIFCEVGWLPQQDHMYFDLSGVNMRSSLVGFAGDRLRPGAQRLLDEEKSRFRARRTGGTPPVPQQGSVFVPLQIETDTSFRMGSPFARNSDFVAFLADWIPREHLITAKLHPKERVRSPPIHSTRRNLRVLKSGSLDWMLLSSEIVVGINSTALLEAAMLDKKIMSFGRGLLSGTGALHEVDRSTRFKDVLETQLDAHRRDAFLFELLFRRQVSLGALEALDYDHLSNRAPFDEILGTNGRAQASPRNHENFRKGLSMIQVGKSRVARSAILDVERGGEIVVGDESEIRHSAVLEISGRYNGAIHIGHRSVVGIGSWLQGSGKIVIGDDVIIGPYAAIVSTNHRYKDTDIPIARQPLETGEITIEDGVWVGAHVTVASNVRIGAHSIIGANSFVNQDIPPYSVAVGSPARVIRSRL